MTEPTDAELIALLGDRQFSTISAVREALRRWGTPPAGAVEPIGYLYCGGSYGDELADWEIVADQHQCDKLNEYHGSLGKEAKLPIYTTPQPTQAQAGAVPLTTAQKLDLISECKGMGGRVGDAQLLLLIEHVEMSHGIKGGQHGAE